MRPVYGTRKVGIKDYDIKYLISLQIKYTNYENDEAYYDIKDKGIHIKIYNNSSSLFK
ncbi:conserved hypothetical protein [Xenorhabdus szentirmaii DSM 16338]|uniref:Uncharacterized protein n=1 Tax=Xenorhabdus szentirmaii DSM 16338 TaxID=1427518 RepID=W1J312_9GAMM|nr:conserved hypothetical protein [Xenorhabdus szentirmaii DSM 16338]